MQDFYRDPDTFLLCFECFWLVDINSGHQPVELPPGKIPDFRLLPWPLIAAPDRQPFIDQDKTIRFTEQSFDPVPSSSTEQEERTGCRIHFKLVFDRSYVKKKYKLRMTFFHLASILSRQVFAPVLIVYSCIVFHTHQAKDIHNDYESLLYYKMSLCTQKQGGMHVYNQIF